ncbi:hypothetical protein Mal64_20650 [Pseudobythopirellula maris]|uniref:DUF4394 domain-containing protein n=1 Tax=Pseudobythopirellula maris TaxID=2527991 RepID=A0A5C5ZP85_9BACT|nr:DUF4394 domain-containing protein [Pseudobythopirellula maris]TWT88581.1 hypothetical protein Mal64_20650 [Pseudobythopirellula maris]
MATRRIFASTFALALVALAPHHAAAEALFGLAGSGINQRLVVINTNTNAVTYNTPISGLVDALGAESLQSIDVRPATGELFGLDNNSNLYTIAPLTGMSTLVGQLSPTPTGTPSTRTIDFNPTVDRIRVLGDSPSNNNLRVNPNDASTLVDGTLAFGAGDTNEGERPFVVGGAYTNSVPGATSTMLYDVEAGLDVLVTQSPANDGTLQTVGPLGVNLINTANASFEISGATGDAYLVFTGFLGSGGNVLYSVDLGTGAATSTGPITGVPSGSVTDIAAVAQNAFPQQFIPEPASLMLLAIAGMLGACGRRAR